MHEADSQNPRQLAQLRWLLALGLVLPSVVTWIYFDLLHDSAPAIQQSAFTFGKIVQFLLPLIAWQLTRAAAEPAHRVIAPKARYEQSSAAGAVSGLLIGSAIIAVYFYFLLPGGWMDGPRLAAQDKLKSMGLNSKSMLLAAAVFYSLFHSGLEEYYWRWFIFGRLTRLVPLSWAIGISSLGFMAHHVIVLARYFSWNSPLTIIFALGVAVGGVVWAELYRRTGSLLGPWISHALVDASIFVIAFDLAFADLPPGAY